MASLDPTALIDSLLAMRKAVRVLCTYWRYLFPVFIGAYLLHLAQTTLLLNLASPRVNLESIPLYVYAIQDNSTAPTAEGLVGMAVAVAVKTSGMEISPLWKLHFIGDLLWTLSLTVIALSFANASREAVDRRPRTREEQRRQGIATSAWRKCKSLAFALVIWDAVSWVMCEILEEGELAYFLHGLVESVYLVAVMVIQEEGLSGRRAIQKACTLVGRRIKVVPIYQCTSVLVLNALVRIVSFVAFSEAHGKDTAAEIFRFSLVSPFVAASVQSAYCFEATACYKKSNERRRRNAAEEAETASASTTSTTSSGNQDVQKLEEEEPEEEESLKEERARAEEATSSPGQAHKALGARAEKVMSSPGRVCKAMGGAGGEGDNQRPKRLRRPNNKYFGPDWTQ